MTDRYYCRDLSGQSVLLTDAEAHHAIHVMRLKVGSKLQLFNGAGTSAEAEVEHMGRRELTVSIHSMVETERPTTGRITVAACIPKGDRLKWMIEKLTEVGVDRFIPLQAHRSVVDPGKSKLHKLDATVIAAAKQCRRDWLMDIAAVQAFDDLINTPDDKSTFFIAHPTNDNSEDSAWPLEHKSDATILIGPEGGFTADEVEQAKGRSAVQISWPAGILRTETAAVVMATVVMSRRSVKVDE